MSWRTTITHVFQTFLLSPRERAVTIGTMTYPNESINLKWTWFAGALLSEMHLWEINQHLLSVGYLLSALNKEKNTVDIWDVKKTCFILLLNSVLLFPECFGGLRCTWSCTSKHTARWRRKPDTRPCILRMKLHFTDKWTRYDTVNMMREYKARRWCYGFRNKAAFDVRRKKHLKGAVNNITGLPRTWFPEEMGQLQCSQISSSGW